MNDFSFMLSAMGNSLRKLPAVDLQYGDLWKLAKSLNDLGLPLREWHPGAETPEKSVLIEAFDERGVTSVALQMAGNERQNYPHIRDITVWNGKEEDGGALFGTMLNAGKSPCTVKIDVRQVGQLKSPEAVLGVVKAVIDIWSPNMVRVAPYAYDPVFEDRVPIGWMAYLPRVIETAQAPEASRLIPVMADRKKQKGTIVVSVDEVFDPRNPEHVKRANDLEIRLVDQDLLPKYVDCYSY